MSFAMTRGQRITARDRTALRRARQARERTLLAPEEIDRRIENAILEAANRIVVHRIRSTGSVADGA